VKTAIFVRSIQQYGLLRSSIPVAFQTLPLASIFRVIKILFCNSFGRSCQLRWSIAAMLSSFLRQRFAFEANEQMSNE
jgi:hypothetical protein